jgi:hypothetical protein
MEWTEGSVVELIELNKGKEIMWDPKYPKYPKNFNKIRKQDM